MTTPRAEAHVRRPHRALVLTISLLVAALVGAGCTGDGGGGDGDDGDGRGDRSGRQVQLDVGVGKVAGAFAKPRRRGVARQVGTVVDRWFEAAYLGGDYPRAVFKDSWPGWTPDLRRQARADRHLTSNARIGRTTASVVPRRKHVRVDILAYRGRQRAATARFVLVFDRVPRKDGQPNIRHRVTGRLMLAPARRGNWRVVGYDVSRSHSVVRGGGDK